MRNRPARQYQKLIQSESESEKVNDNQRTTMIGISVTGDIVITQHDHLLCRLHDQLGWRATDAWKAGTSGSEGAPAQQCVGATRRWNFRKYKGKLLQKPSKDNLATVRSRISEIISANKTAKQENLIQQLNPVIRGWANYHRHAVAKRAFSSLDHQIWIMLWQWAKRRHPNKGARWIKKKYFMTTGMRNWVFGCKDKDGNVVTLVKASDTAIVRHVKIKGDANPFDSNWNAYFEDRIGRQMGIKGRNQKKLVHLLLQQNGNCQSCGDAITSQTRWTLQNTVPRVLGESDKFSNRVLVHENCHGLFDSRSLKAV